MAEETPAAATVEGAAKPKKKKKSKTMLFIVLAVVLVAVGGGVYAMRGRGGPSEAPAPTRGLVPFNPFVVNLADPGGMRFVRVTMQVVVEDESGAKEVIDAPVEFKEARSVILEILSQQTANDLVKLEGKQALKKAIIERLKPVLKKTKVIDVFFSEFVVQF